MARYDAFLSDWLSPNSLSFGAGVAVAVGVLWQVRPAGLLAALNSPIGVLLVGASLVTVFLSERYRETIRQEPLYFVAGVAMGVVLAARLFS